MSKTDEKNTRSWVVDGRGVDIFREKCSELRWRFHETPQGHQPDLGKDGYLEFTNESGMAVFCAAIQIKGVRSLYNSEQYELEVSKLQCESWRFSTVPVLGIVLDPETQLLYWCDITKTLREQGRKARVYAHKNNQLNSEEGCIAFHKYALARSAASHITFALASEDVSIQVGGAEDVLSFCKSDHRYLILLRRTMFGLHYEALDYAIFVLGKFALNPDVLVDKLHYGIEFCGNIRKHFK